MKVTKTLLAILIICSLIGFKPDRQVELINNSNTHLNGAILKRLLLKNIQREVKDNNVTLTVVSYSKASEESPIRTDDADSRLMTKRITYQSSLILTIGDKTQNIIKNDVWVGRLGGPGLNPPTDEELIVGLVSKYLSERSR